MVREIVMLSICLGIKKVMRTAKLWQFGKDVTSHIRTAFLNSKGLPWIWCLLSPKKKVLGDTIHRSNLKAMSNIQKTKKTIVDVKKSINLNEKKIEIARERGLSSTDLLAYDIFLFPNNFQ